MVEEENFSDLIHCLNPLHFARVEGLPPLDVVNENQRAAELNNDLESDQICRLKQNGTYSKDQPAQDEEDVPDERGAPLVASHSRVGEIELTEQSLVLAEEVRVCVAKVLLFAEEEDRDPDGESQENDSEDHSEDVGVEDRGVDAGT